METMVLLKEASTLATPEVMFFDPLALRTLMAPSSSLSRSSAVGCLATPPTMGPLGASGAGAFSPALAGPSFAEASAGAAAAGAASAAPLGARGFFAALGAASPPAFAGASGAAPSAGLAETGFCFLDSDSSAMMKNY